MNTKRNAAHKCSITALLGFCAHRNVPSGSRTFLNIRTTHKIAKKGQWIYTFTRKAASATGYVFLFIFVQRSLAGLCQSQQMTHQKQCCCPQVFHKMRYGSACWQFLVMAYQQSLTNTLLIWLPCRLCWSTLSSAFVIPKQESHACCFASYSLIVTWYY